MRSNHTYTLYRLWTWWIFVDQTHVFTHSMSADQTFFIFQLNVRNRTIRCSDEMCLCFCSIFSSVVFNGERERERQSCGVSSGAALVWSVLALFLSNGRRGADRCRIKECLVRSMLPNKRLHSQYAQQHTTDTRERERERRLCVFSCGLSMWYDISSYWLTEGSSPVCVCVRVCVHVALRETAVPRWNFN